MRRIRYIVAVSLDGFIAGPHGEFDWIDTDPDVDFAAIWAQFDTGLMGRLTYQVAVERLGKNAFRGMTTIVFSRTMKQEAPATHHHPRVTHRLGASAEGQKRQRHLAFWRKPALPSLSRRRPCRYRRGLGYPRPAWRGHPPAPAPLHSHSPEAHEPHALPLRPSLTRVRCAALIDPRCQTVSGNYRI